MLFFPYIDMDMINLAKDMLFGGIGYIGLRGSGWAKSKLLSTEIKIYLHCDFAVNTTAFHLVYQQRYL